MTLPARKPDWLRVRLPAGPQQDQFHGLKARLRSRGLHTVCEEARCPNIFECWGQGTATVMILGETCTRGCRFCSVQTGKPGGSVDPNEPENTAISLAEMGLAYVVLTMVDRDDLADGGAAHVAKTVHRIRHHSPELRVETLVGDFQGEHDALRVVVQEGSPDVFAHNVEVVPRLQRSIRDVRCSWERSVDALVTAKQLGASIVKTSLMVGLGEERDEVLDAMNLLREADVDVITIGQYLRPTKRHAAVQRYVEPAEFEDYEKRGLEMGFRFVASGPLVRSSYRAAEVFLEGALASESPRKAAPAMNRYGKKRKLDVLG
ncbi:MAG: lipoyl synthase [Deltaproteobacteria bacterium]|nr:lipoyl synthase [Deltaproteobacteria bacterium]NND27135.1 lipoyl synthase [Myxococcales bacterium]MBT8466726.1 lipoyl synthase [Deltaproteobacteria bacterium]MBT8483737.1 lipoyl synthase [Deltaproteobacteria bacterium]NNK08813.1 lipoyl synthase [Myxococcales bacterium]